MNHENVYYKVQIIYTKLLQNMHSSENDTCLFTDSGADILRLTRSDMIELCGLSDGIRLNNTVMAK